MTTESYFYKFIWAVLILSTFGFGFKNIYLAVTDYYKFDKITNIERVTPENVTFPAITICGVSEYEAIHDWPYDKYTINNRSESRIKEFIDFEQTYFEIDADISLTRKSRLNVTNHIDYFKLHDKDVSLDCFRFDAVTNKSVELLKSSNYEDNYQVVLKTNYVEQMIINYNTYNNNNTNNSNESYIRQIRYSFSNPFFIIVISNNQLKSNIDEKLKHIMLPRGSTSFFEIAKESLEIKLPEPYNHCKESSANQYYHQSDCIETCIFKEIKDKYNCTYPLSLFEIQGLKECSSFDYSKEFYLGCKKECPLESCFSEKFTHSKYLLRTAPSSTLFKFSFRDMSSLNISQIPKTDPYTFLNNIGGGLGLFMGIAFPNLIEFLQFIFEILLIFFVPKK